MKQSVSTVAAVILGSVLTIGSLTAPSMARDKTRHHAARVHGMDNVMRCNDAAADDQGFGGFSGAPGHPFMGPGIGGHDWGGDYWDDDPFWEPDPYYVPYDGTAYVPSAAHRHAARDKSVGRCI